MHPVLNMKLCRVSLKYKARYPEEKFFKQRGLIFHKGIDFTPKWGHKNKTFYLRAPVSGIVEAGGYSPSWGFHCIISSKESDKPAKHILAHMAKVFVNPGKYVRKGQTIGIMGDSGWSKGKHLHYEVRKPNKNKVWISVDPKEYLT